MERSNFLRYNFPTIISRKKNRCCIYRKYLFVLDDCEEKSAISFALSYQSILAKCYKRLILGCFINNECVNVCIKDEEHCTMLFN